MGNEVTDEVQVDILRAIKAVLSKWLLIFLAVCGAMGAAYFFFDSRKVPTYSSSGKIYVIDREEKEIKVSIEELNIGSQLVEDYKSLVTSRLVLETVIKRLHLNITYTELAHSITIENPPDTRIIMISLKYDDKNSIKNILNTIEKVTCNELADRLGTEHPTILEHACDPNEYFTTSPIKMSLIAGLLVAVMLAGCIGLLDILNNKVRYKEEIEKNLKIPMLVNIPKIPEENRVLRRRRKR